MVYLPRPICNHDFYNVCNLLVDHNLWSTLHAIIVPPRFFSTPMYFAGRPYFVVYPPHVYTI